LVTGSKIGFLIFPLALLIDRDAKWINAPLFCGRISFRF